MSDDWKTPGQRRRVGHTTDAAGYSVAFEIDRGDVIIRRGGLDIRLRADEREHFQRLYMQAEREAEAWAAAHAAVSDEDNRPDDHGCPIVVIRADGQHPCARPAGHELPHDFVLHPAT